MIGILLHVKCIVGYRQQSLTHVRFGAFWNIQE